MPGNGNPRGTSEDSPDLVGEELGDGAHIWRVYDQVAREEDRERIGNWNRGLDNLALFAGLFSAVTTAFIIELQQDTEPDYARLTFLVLNASAAGVPFRQEPFAVDPSVRVTNCLWIASLMLSLTAALIAIMGKDWIGMYSSRPLCNPRQWAEIRTYRLACVERWYMSGVIAAAPVLLHFSLVLFAAGLILFISSDGLSQRVALALSLAAGSLYLVTVLSATVFASSPFKSPATQILRRAVFATLSLLRDSLFARPKRHPIAILQQASLIIGALLSRLIPATIVPLDRSQRRRLSAGDIGLFWSGLFADHSASRDRSWGQVAQRFAAVSSAQFFASVRTVEALLRSATDEYHYHWQHPRTRPWHISMHFYMRHLELSDQWSDIRMEPTPQLLANSLSQLNAMTQSTDVFRSILMALGDISIGRKVAPLVSADLRSRLAAEIRHNWRKADLVTLSRYILVDQHLPKASLSPRSVIAQFQAKDHTTAVRSESIVFALAELSSVTFIASATICHHCPEVTVQPRALHHLLPLLSHEDDIDLIIALAQRYWHHVKDDRSFDLKQELLKRMGSSREGLHEWQFPRCPGRRRIGLVELLAFRVGFWDISVDFMTATYSLILGVIKQEPFGTQHPCLVYAFGSSNAQVADAAWATPPGLRFYLAGALPLERSFTLDCDESDVDLAVGYHKFFEICLARTIVRLLTPSREFHNFFHWDSRQSRDSPTTLDLCTLRLYAQLCSALTELDDDDRNEIFSLMLDSSVLIRLCWEPNAPAPLPRAERHTLNIMTAIARHIGHLMDSEDSFDTGARLLVLFASSTIQSSSDCLERWDLGAYLRDAWHANRRASMRRLMHAVHALRPLCTKRHDVHAAWQLIELSPDVGYTDSFWDDEDFELAGFPVADGDAAAGKEAS